MNSSSSTNDSNHLNHRKRVTLVDHPPSSNAPLNKRPKLEQPGDQDEEDDDQDTPEDEIKLENFRKEAVYREMLQYKRNYLRAQSEIDRLRSERLAYEVKLSKVEIGWTNLVREAELILPSTSAAATNGNGRAASPPLTDLTLNDEELEQALSQRSTATKQLLQRLQGLHPSSNDEEQRRKVVELEENCRRLLEQSLQSQETLRIVRLTHDETLVELEQTHAALLRAEKKFDRYQSATVAAIEGRIAPAAAVAAAAAGAGSPAGTTATGGGGVGSSSSSTLNGVGTDGSRGGPGGGKGKESSSLSHEILPGQGRSDDASGAADDVAKALNEEVEELRDLVGRRGQELEELRNDRIALKLEIDNLKVKLVDLPDDVIADTATFRMLQTHVQYLSGEYDTKRLEAERSTLEADQLRELVETHREEVTREATEQVTELEQRLTSNESDLNRLRSTRDELQAQANEFKARDTERSRAVDELRILAESRQGRIEVYQSEVKRLRMDRAAMRGDVEGVEMRSTSEGGTSEEDLVDDLKKRLNKAEDLLLALRDQLSSYATAAASTEGAPNVEQLVRSETEARTELTRAMERLKKLEHLVGEEGDPQISELVQRLEEREKELKTAQAQVQSQEAAANMLYGEIDRLSAAWSALDEQNSSKVFNLSNLEEKIQRLSAEKAKADNRYFATMRQKDALANENVVLTKLAEKQQQKVDAANEVQHSLSLSIAEMEKEITMHQNNVRAYAESVASLRRENSEALLRSEQNGKRIAELTALLTERITQAETEQATRKRSEEQLAKVERQLQQAIAKAATVSAASTSTTGTTDSNEIRELKKYNADLSKMLKCSTCNLRFKSVIINRCGHTFCKECVEARLANRQRKCPNCGGMFGKDDVGPVYF